jgi:hypothetical protein
VGRPDPDRPDHDFDPSDLNGRTSSVGGLFEEAGFFVVDLGGLRKGAEMQQVGAPLAGPT